MSVEEAIGMIESIWGGDLLRELPDGVPVGEGGGRPRPPRCSECEQYSVESHGLKHTRRYCEIGWDHEGYDDRGARPIPAERARSSPDWCPKREGKA